MRGYTQQNVSMNSTVQESFLSKKIEDYTIKDCEKYLDKYPKDLDAYKVRKRLQELNKPIDGVVEEQLKAKSSAISATSHGGQSSTSHISGVHPSYFRYKLWKIVWRTIFVIACLIIVILFIICTLNSDIKIFYSYGGHFVWHRFGIAGLWAASLLGWLGNKADF